MREEGEEEEEKQQHEEEREEQEEQEKAQFRTTEVSIRAIFRCGQRCSGSTILKNRRRFDLKREQ